MFCFEYTVYENKISTTPCRMPRTGFELLETLGFRIQLDTWSALVKTNTYQNGEPKIVYPKI